MAFKETTFSHELEGGKMQKWEYIATLLEANAEQHLPWLRQAFPDAKQFARFTPKALIPDLNELGKDGWELVSCELVRAGDNLDLLTPVPVYGQVTQYWSHTYLCVFKRPQE